jgi:hypothetical protein
MQKANLLAPKDHHSDLNVAFEEIVNISTQKIWYFSLVDLVSTGGMLSNTVMHDVLGRVLCSTAICAFCASQAL